MNKNSNTYIIVYSVVMVVVVALLLSVAALSLKERQEANMLNEKKQAILKSLYAAEAAREGVAVEQYIADNGLSYDELISAYVIDAEGRRIEGEDVFELLKDVGGAYKAGKFPLFEAKDGRVVLPVTGTGLWGPIWGYVALGGDMNTVAGIIMDHKGETPGLGAEIATPKYQARFVGKTIFEGDEFTSVALKKGGAAKESAHEVDAISGGTKTSDGVTAMLYNSIGHYLPLLEARRAAAAGQPVETEEAAVSNEENVENNE